MSGSDSEAEMLLALKLIWGFLCAILHILHLPIQERNMLVVSGLHPASLYRLEVETITAEGEGPKSSRTFQTPGHQTFLRESK